MRLGVLSKMKIWLLLLACMMTGCATTEQLVSVPSLADKRMKERAAYRAMAEADGWYSVTIYREGDGWYLNAYNRDGRKAEHNRFIPEGKRKEGITK